MNYDSIHTFVKGLRSDYSNNAESNETFQKGINGRLYSENGIISYSSIEGTKEVYNNPQIVKYLGWYSFIDELIIFVKQKNGDNPLFNSFPQFTIETISDYVINDVNIDLSVQTDFNPIDEIEVDNIEINYEQLIQQPFAPACLEPVVPFDQSILYSINNNVPNLVGATVINNYIPINNREYMDAIYSLKIDSNGNITDKLIWSGYQNWDIDSKIVTIGIKETQNIKSVYYTDFLNQFRKVNIKVNDVEIQSTADFNLFKNTPLLQPKFVSLIDGGQLPAMSVIYSYRLISNNGQVTEFGPLSKSIKIPVKKNLLEYKGGEPQEISSYGVKLKCEVLNMDGYSEIECIAIEYGAKEIPTAIKSLGIKQINGVVEFIHYGNEEDYSSNITISDIIEKKVNWKYCSAIEHENNKLIAAGLRNNPVAKIENELIDLFRLKAYSQSGMSFTSCQYNPKPDVFQYIFPEYTNPLITQLKRRYKSIQIYGNCTVSLINTITNENIQLIIYNPNTYTENLNSIKEFLLNEQDTNPIFNNKFPNLKISVDEVGNLVFGRILIGVETDISIYELAFDTLQVQQEIDYENDYNSNQNFIGLNAVNGAISLGFNSGTGIRLSYVESKKELLAKATEPYNGNNNLLNIISDTDEKSFFKGEIYRLFIQFKSVDNEYFAIPLGDIKIPEIGSAINGINDAGFSFITSNTWANQIADDSVNKLYAILTKLKVEVRIDNRFKKYIDTYQLMYVERTEYNRTILCQGISAPLMRLNPPREYGTRWFDNEKDKSLSNHWILPYAGGPAFDKIGFDVYDQHGQDYDIKTYDNSKRVIYSRKLIYFDSPDLIYNTISNQLIQSSKLNILGRLKDDHDLKSVATSGRSTRIYTNFGLGPLVYPTSENEVYPKYSRKIFTKLTELPAYDSVRDYPYFLGGDLSYNMEYFNNFTVFKTFELNKRIVNIHKSVELKPGEITSSLALDTMHDISNNALYVPMNQAWFYGNAQRSVNMLNRETRHQYQVIGAGNKAQGKSTVFINAEQNIFTNDFLGPLNPNKVNSQIRNGNYAYNIYTTHALINIFRDNIESVYGGRTLQDYSSNIVVPLGQALPIYRQSNAAQVSIENGDTYVTLFTRFKTGGSNSDYWEHNDEAHPVNNGGTNPTNAYYHNIKRYKNYQGFWAYAVILETMVKPNLSYDNRIDIQKGKIDFNVVDDGDNMNSGYLQENTIKVSIPKPFRFEDDPDMGNQLAVSKTKLNGDYYDAWSSFMVNEFYELDKDKGFIHNLAKEDGALFAIQEKGIAQIQIDEKTLIPTENGKIAVKSGTGTSISDHKYISEYGTAIRRAIIKSPFGFMFFDENKFEYVQKITPMLLNNDLHLEFSKHFKNDRIVDTEGYYDPKYKETNVRIRTSKGLTYLLSYNEVFKCFNGLYEYNNDLYIVYDNKVFAPITNYTSNGIESNSLHKLNEELYLNLFNEEKTMKLGITCAIHPTTIKHFKSLLANISISHKINSVKINTNIRPQRNIPNTHHWYKIREGMHSIPFKNTWSEYMPIEEYKDMIGYWAYIELDISSFNNEKIDIFALTINLRKSHM